MVLIGTKNIDMHEERFSPEELRRKGDPWFFVVEDRTHFARSFCRGRDVIDAPCGAGWTTHEISKVSSRIVGVDVDREAIASAQRDFRTPNVQFHQMDCLNLNFPMQSFDVAVSIEAIEHFSASDGVRYISRLAKVLRPGGMLVGTTPSAPNPVAAEARRLKEDNPHHLKIYCEQELRQLFAPHFDCIWIEDMPFGCFYFVAHRKLTIKRRILNFTPLPLRPWLTHVRSWVRALTGV